MGSNRVKHTIEDLHGIDAKKDAIMAEYTSALAELEAIPNKDEKEVRG